MPGLVCVPQGEGPTQRFTGPTHRPQSMTMERRIEATLRRLSVASRVDGFHVHTGRAACRSSYLEGEEMLKEMPQVSQRTGPPTERIRVMSDPKLQATPTPTTVRLREVTVVTGVTVRSEKSARAGSGVNSQGGAASCGPLRCDRWS